jgi:chorismate dehydratase
LKTNKLHEFSKEAEFQNPSSEIKITAVSYLNTKPFLFGIFQSGLDAETRLSLDIPSECARKLAAGEVDLGLVPVALLTELGESWVVSKYCIGSTGAVNTVCIFSEKPLSEIKKLWLDFHSKTSVALVKILFHEFWQRSDIEFLPAIAGFEEKIGGDTAALVIGDRAIPLLKKYPIVIDLAEIWTEMTGLPFVFAAWVSKKPLEPDFLEKLNRAFEIGLENIPNLTMLLPPVADFDLKKYYTKNISYELNSLKIKGLELFLKKMNPEFDFAKIHFS